jgi:hypothetical protein
MEGSEQIDLGLILVCGVRSSGILPVQKVGSYPRHRWAKATVLRKTLMATPRERSIGAFTNMGENGGINF